MYMPVGPVWQAQAQAVWLEAVWPKPGTPAIRVKPMWLEPYSSKPYGSSHMGSSLYGLKPHRLNLYGLSPRLRPYGFELDGLNPGFPTPRWLYMPSEVLGRLVWPYMPFQVLVTRVLAIHAFLGPWKACMH